MKAVFVTVLLLVSSFALASEKYTWLCEGRHEYQPRDYQTEFSLTVDLATIKEEGSKQSIAAFIETTKKSKMPEQGFSELVQLELLKYEELGETTYLDVQGQDLPVNGSMLTFFTLGLDLPDDGRSIIFSSFVDGVPLDGNCLRRVDLDGLWSEQPE
jgi:hypothetical protein